MMRVRRPMALLLGCSLGMVALAHAGGDAVAKVGTQEISRADFERRIRQVPALQLATFGKTPAAQRRAFLDRVVVPEVLFSAAGEQDGVTKRPDVRVRLDDALRAALMADLRREAEREIGDTDVAKYFEENKQKLDVPERLHIHRILVATKDEAESVLATAKKPGGEREWPKLAREKSLDKATHERGGDLGFLAADGQSHEVTVKAEPEIVAAAKKVKNGELVPEPIAVDGKFAVVWRRGSTAAVTRTLEQEAAPIRGVLVRQRLEEKTKKLLDDARKAKVTDVHEDLLAWLDQKNPPATSAKRDAPPAPSGATNPKPKPGPDGLR